MWDKRILSRTRENIQLEASLFNYLEKLEAYVLDPSNGTLMDLRSNMFETQAEFPLLNHKNFFDF
jgi:hypothetical protein